MTFEEVSVRVLTGSLAVLTIACVFAGVWRVIEQRGDWREGRFRRRLLFNSAILLIATVAWNEAYAWYMWGHGVWHIADTSVWLVIPPEITALVALITFGGVSLWPSCKHRGWIAMVAVAALGAVSALVF